MTIKDPVQLERDVIRKIAHYALSVRKSWTSLRERRWWIISY